LPVFNLYCILLHHVYAYHSLLLRIRIGRCNSVDSEDSKSLNLLFFIMLVLLI